MFILYQNVYIIPKYLYYMCMFIYNSKYTLQAKTIEISFSFLLLKIISQYRKKKRNKKFQKLIKRYNIFKYVTIYKSGDYKILKSKPKEKGFSHIKYISK
ncbi:hypothetical protein PFAG_04351 [Plasmodium falciparum Santa Lucia]|uniref:Uncharacterized protein n=1 Tax=Plasmodium falciparum Santa Lucia TaxID=478859 RepID=W7G0C7_PLAFA|nr:hypothetical protein PFAG_04351 [Plasmodium falciparum Santa Lucia]